MSESEIFTNNSYIAEAAGEEITAADKILHEDFAILSNEDFINKYGEDAFNSMAAQRAVIDDAAVNALASGTRSWGETVGDTAKNIISGALTGATGAASLLTTPVRPLSESFANLTRDINEFSQSIGSDAEKAQRKLYEFKQEGLKARLDREIREAESQGKSVSFFEKIGKEALGSVDNLISTGHGAELIGSGLGSLLVGGPMTKGVSKAASFIGSKTPALSNAINKAAQQSATVAKIKEAAPWMTAMGLQEGGGAYGDMLLKGLEVSTEELMANSPEFQTLYKDYRSDGLNHEQAAEEARRDLAFTAARVTGALTAGAAGVANYLTAGLGKGLDKASLARSIISPLVAKADDTALSSIKDGLLEPVEEAITEGLGQAASNLATKLYLDKNQALDEDIGSSMAEGAVGGLGISGIRAAGAGTSLATDKVNQLLEERKLKQEELNKSKPKVIDLSETIVSSSPMKITDNEDDTRTATQVASDTQELVKQNKEINDSLLNPETSIKDEESGFDSASLDLPADVKEKFEVESKAELLNKIVDEALSNEEGEVSFATEEDIQNAEKWVSEDIQKLQAFFNKVEEGKVSISSEAEAGLRSQYQALLAAHKNLVVNFQQEQLPENLQAEKTAYDAIHNPETVTVERLDKALKSSDKFNEQQIKVISSIRDFYAKEKANTAHREQIKEISPTSSLVSKNVIWGEEDSYNETGKYSLKQLASEVYKGIAYGNEAKAKASLENVRKLAQHFENKVKAANTSYKNGGKEVKFDRLNAKTKEFDKDQGTVYWDPKEDNSLYLARALEYDLARVVQAYNHLVDLAPNLGFQPITEYAHLTDGKGAGIDLPAVKEVSPTLNANPDEEILAPWEGEDEFSVPETKQEVSQEPEVKKEEVVTETSPSEVTSESSTETPVTTEVTEETVSEEKKPEVTDKEKEAKKAESIKALGEKIRERFKKTPLAHLFTSKGGLGSRLNILAQFPKYKLTDVINNPELKKRFLAYDSDPSKVSAITKLNKAERDAWTRILDLVDSEIIPGINKRAQDSLLSIEAKKKAYGKDTSNLNGNYHLNLFKDGKYPEDLVRAVSLATISSVLQSQHSKDNEQLAEMLGIEEAQLSTLPVKQILLAQKGMNRFSLLTDIVKKTKNYLDVRELSDIPLGQTEGVIAAIAHGALESLARSKSELGISPVKLTITTQEGRETPQILVLNRKLDDVIAGNTYFLDNLLLDSKSGLIKEFWMSSSNMPVFPKLNHTDQDIKEDQIKAIENRQKVEYNINQEAYDLFNAMGEKGLIAFFSENPEGKEDLYHEDHLASIEGKNLALSRTFKIMQHEYEVASEIAKNWNIPLRNVKRHYSYNISKVGRQQMEGAATPQGDKIIREVMSCTRSVVNLNDPENKALYTRCIAQGFGIKVNNLSLNEIEAELEKIQKSDAFKLIQEFFKKEKPTTDEILFLKDAFKVAKIDATAVGLMCAKDYCKFLDQSSDTKALSKYETYVYLEADGVTNGTANLLMLTNAKELDEETLIALERVGVKYGSASGKSLAQIKAENPEAKDDTYTWVAKEISKDLKEISEDLLNAYKTVFEFFGDFDSENNAFKRNVVKNPVTTVGYGAGVNTLALKIYRDLEDKFNTKISEANVKYMQDPEHSSWLSAFTGIENPKEALAKVKELNDAVKLIASNSEQGPNASLLPLEALKNLKGLDLVSKVRKVKFLSENTKEHKKVYTFGFYTLGNAINEATNKNLGKKNRFGENLDSKSTLTYFNNLNNLSYFLQKFTYEFLEKKALESLGNQKQFGLTNAQYKAINAAARKFALVLDSGSRVIYPAKFKRATSKNYIYTSQPVVESKREAIIDPKTGKRTYGKEHFNLKGQVTPDKIKDLSFAPEVMQPANPGVALMPGMIIGFGDAEMMSYLSDLPRSLDVFDGDNFPINLINEYGVLANEAVWKSWQTNLATVVKHSFANVISSVTPDFFDSFWDSLVSDPNSANTNEFISFVSNAFYDLSYPDISFEKGKFVLSKKTPNGIIQKTLTKDALFKLITTNQISELHDLEVKFAKTIAARKAVNMSVDQMASSENPYFHEGMDNRELSIEEVLAIYNNTYASTHVEPSKVDLTKKDNPLLTEIPSASSPNFSAEISEQGSEEKVETPQSSKLPEPKVEPVKEITVNRKKMRVSLRKLRDILYRGLTPKQLKLFKSIRGIDATNFLKTYTIYSGSREELNALLREDAVSASLNEGDKGLYNPGTKTLYIVGSDATTTFHEMIHAFVADKVTTVCSELGNDFRPQIINGVPPTVVSAVIALKDIAADFISEDFTIDTDPRLVEVQAIIRDYFEKGQIDAGINELIAYSLSDETVGNYFSGKLGTFDLLGSGSEGFFKTVKQYILKTLRQVKRILFGSTSGGTGNDVLTEIAFYTRIIHTKNVSTDVKVSEMLKAVSASLAGQIPAFKQISDLVTDAIKKKAPNWDKIDNLRNKIINKLIPEISSHIPSMDMSEQNACELILEAFLGVNKVHPEVFSRISDMYQYARSKVTVEDFMQDPTDSTQRPAAEEKYYALFGDNLTSNANLKVPTFFAIALSSSEVKSVLSGIEVKRTKESTSEFFLDKKLEEAGSFVINKLSDILNSSNESTVDDLLVALADSLIKTSLEEAYKPSNVKKQVDKLNSRLGKTVQEKAEKVLAWGNNNKLDHPFIKAIKAFIAAISVPFTKEDTVQRAFSAAERELSSIVNEHNAIGHVITDLIGRTDDNGEVYDLIKPIKADVQQARSRYKEVIPKLLKEHFSRKLEDSELRQLYFGLGKIDIASLGLGPIVRRYFSSPSYLKQEIKRLEGVVKDPDMLANAKHLATYIATGKITTPMLLKNAEAIVANLHKKATALKPLDANLVTAVDQLTTMYAIQMLDSKTVGTINKLFVSEKEGMNILVGALKFLKTAEEQKDKGNARFNALKGYIPAENHQDYSIVLGTPAQEDSLLAQGYIRREAYSGAPNTYYYSLDFSRSPFNEGVFQIVKESVNGVDVVTGFSQEIYGKITGPDVWKHFQKTKNLKLNTEEAYTPVFNAYGELMGYEKTIAQAVKDKYLRPNYDITSSIGAMQGRQYEEKIAKIKNEALIKKLASAWNHATYSQRRGYVSLEDRMKNDPVLTEAWELIPKKYQMKLKASFNGGPIMIPATMVEDIIGIRSASIGDIYTGVSRWSPRTQAYARQAFKVIFGADEGKALRVLSKIENTLKRSMSALRTTIVIRSLVVPIKNIVSNIFDLLICGVSPAVLAKEAPRIIIQIEKYQKIQKQLIEQELLLQSGQANTRAIRTKIASLKENLEKLEDIKPLIDAGEFSTVADLNQGDEDTFTSAGDYLGFLETLAEKSPKELKNIMRYALISKDTALYKALHKTVVYGDFVAKCILYKHLKARGNSEKTVLALVKEHFVDYDRISGRTRDYLESIGAMWFYNYKLRILKTALWLMRHNPLYALMSVTLPIDAVIGDFDTPITENIVAKFKDLLNTLGTDMASRAPFMNLWVNLFT